MKNKIISYIIKDYLSFYNKNSVISFGRNKTIDYLFGKNIISNNKNYIFSSKRLNKKFNNGKKKIYNIDLHIGFINLNLENFYTNFGNKNFLFENILCKYAKKRLFFIKNSQEKKFNSELNFFSFDFIKNIKRIGIISKILIKNKNFIRSNNNILSESFFKNEKDLILYNFINKFEVFSNSYIKKKIGDTVIIVSDDKIFLNKKS